MNPKNRFNYGHALRQRDIQDKVVAAVLPEKVESSLSPKSSFLSIVYAINETTGLPTGDLSYMVSDKVNPEIKQWVLDNILIDTSSAAAPAPPRGLSDDDIAALARDPKESPRDYMNRVNMYAQTNQQLYERLATSARQGNGKQVQSVSPGTEAPAVASE